MRQINKARCARQGSKGGALVAFALTGLAAPGALAEEWRVTPRITVEEAYNSNIDLAPKGQERSDFITSVSPGASVRGTGRRLSLNFDYDPEQLFYLNNSDRNELRHRFRGLTNVELLEQLLFFEASGSVNQQFTSNTGAIGGTTLTASNNLNTVQTYTLGPVLRNHLGTFADTELRYSFSAVSSDAEDVSDTITNTLSFIMRSGRDFSQLGWTITANTSEAERSGGLSSTSGSGSRQSLDGTTTDRQLLRFDTQYALDSSFSLLSGVGYEKIEDPTLNEQPDGEIWELGFQFRPNSLSSMRLTAGQRYGGANYNLDVDYQPSPITRFRAGYVQTINTSQALAVQNLGQLGLSPGGVLIDQETGRPFLPGDPRFGLTNSAFRQDRFTAGVEINSLRNRYNFDIFDEKRDFDTDVTQNAHSFGFTLGFNREVTPLISFNAGASISRTELKNDNDRQDDFYSASAGLSYRLSDTASARLSYRYTDRESNAANSDIVENVITATLTKEF